MLLQEAIGYQIKDPVPSMGYHLSIYYLETKQIQDIAIAVG